MDSGPTRIALFGGSGATGHEVIAAASLRGWRVSALVRHAGSLPPTASHVREIVGGLDSRETVREALEGSGAVVMAIGARAPYRDVFCAAATRCVVEAARAVGVERLVCVTGALIGRYPANQGRLFFAMSRAFAGDGSPSMRDRAEQEDVIRRSGLAWTIVKPPRLTSGARTGRVAMGAHVRAGLLSSISRADLAQVLLDLCAKPGSGETLFVKEARRAFP